MLSRKINPEQKLDSTSFMSSVGEDFVTRFDVLEDISHLSADKHCRLVEIFSDNYEKLAELFFFWIRPNIANYNKHLLQKNIIFFIYPVDLIPRTFAFGF